MAPQPFAATVRFLSALGARQDPPCVRGEVDLRNPLKVEAYFAGPLDDLAGRERWPGDAHHELRLLRNEAIVRPRE